MRPLLLAAAAVSALAAAAAPPLSLCIALVPVDARHAAHATDASHATDAHATDAAQAAQATDAAHATDHATGTAHAMDATEETSEGRLAAPRPRSNPTSAALPTAAPTAAPTAVPTPRGQVNFCNPRLLKPIGDVQHVGVKYEPIRPILLWGEGATETPLASSEAQEDQMVGGRD